MSDIHRYQPDAEADVCLLLEGTYPFVRGGVSSWVKQLIDSMPELRFSIVYLGADKSSTAKLAYELPENLVHLETHSLMEHVSHDTVLPSAMTRLKALPGLLSRRKLTGERLNKSCELHHQLRSSEAALDIDVLNSFAQLMMDESAITAEHLETHPQSWQTIKEHYAQAPEGLDFNHFFWTVRSMHAPLFKLSDIARQAPEARLYHAVSTGYAGFLGALLQSTAGKPFIITEHGIYTKERELDLAQVNWIPETYDPFKVGLNDNMDYLRLVWIRFFVSLGRMAYSSASQILTLFEGNRLRQIKDGAQPEKLKIVPNGVDVQRFSSVRRAFDAPIPPVIALIGRIVPIKDIKCFIRALQIIRATVPEIQGWLVGPEDENPGYTGECRELVQNLGLSGSIQFMGFQRPDDIFPQIGLCALTSVSEGQPLVVLEGYAAGIPSVTTDVGSCSELAYGVTDADKALGQSGSVVPIADPAAFAEAAVKLLSDTNAWRMASKVAMQRVETYYNEKDMIATYSKIYSQHIDNTGSSGESSDQAKVA